MQSYLSLLTADTSSSSLASLYRGVINLQARYILEAPHCNSFQPPVESGLAPTQNQELPDNFSPPVASTTVFECKYELDSLAAFLEISTNYYEATGDIDFFRKFQWVDAVKAILDTGYDGYLGQEYIPARPDAIASLAQGYRICKV